jgi:hypothetical protein
MKQLPLPVRITAGLVVTAVEQARKLPKQLAGLPVTVVSEALQMSMRVQQQITELAIRGDDILARLRPVEEAPQWATFDEDTTEAPPESTSTDDDGGDPWAAEERALAEEYEVEADEAEEVEADEVEADEAEDGPPAAMPNYNELSLPQLRARLRMLSEDDLVELLGHERSHAARPQFIGMLNRRIATVRAQS